MERIDFVVRTADGFSGKVKNEPEEKEASGEFQKLLKKQQESQEEPPKEDERKPEEAIGLLRVQTVIPEYNPVQSLGTGQEEATQPVIPVREGQGVPLQQNVSVNENPKGEEPAAEMLLTEAWQAVEEKTANPVQTAGEHGIQTPKDGGSKEPEALKDVSADTVHTQKTAETVGAEERPPLSGQETEKEQPDERAEYRGETGTGSVKPEVKPQNGAEMVRKQNATGTRLPVKDVEEIPQLLSKQIAEHAAKGRTEFEIQIAPEHLGKIAVRVLYENGQTSISILCSEKQTFDIVGKHAGEIGVYMEKNLGETSVYVEQNQPDYQDRQDTGYNQAGRESEQQRQREQSEKQRAKEEAGQFLQKLRLGLLEA